MRILYSHRIQSHDGQSVHLEELVSAFRAAGHEVLVIGPHFYESSGLGAENHAVQLARRLLPAALAELAELAYNIVAWRRLRRAAASFHPDIIYERYNLFYLAGAWLARRRRILFYVEVNAPLAEERGRFGGLRLARMARHAERFVWHSADRVFAVTGELKERICATGVAESRIAVTPNGVALERFRPRAPGSGLHGNDRQQVTLGFVGFVRTWHGLDSVIRGMAAEAPDLRLVIAGEGPARSELERLAEQLGCVERVRFIGLIERAEVPTVLEGFDIALQPLALSYASPLKLFEYMAAGLAIVAPDQPNIREIVAHEETALLFNPSDNGALWQAVSRFAGNASLRVRLGKAAREVILQRDLTWRGNALRVARMAEADLSRRDRAGTGMK